MDYKSTLNLPKTDFSMKANLPQKEPEILRNWREGEIYDLIRSKCKGRAKYILHDGPPYANGDIHIGHALNKILKDIIIKFKTMRGFDCPFVPGWDCHGLPVEHQLFKELKIRKQDIDQLEFREKARDFALRFVNIQKEQFKRLGVFGDWDNPYLTLTPKYEAGILETFRDLIKADFIYKGLKPVNWCFSCETALAEAEVEYEDSISPSIYVKFKLLKEQKEGDLPPVFRQLSNGQLNNIYFVIWTTTPWTLVSNVAIAVHPAFTYELILVNNEVLIVARDLVKQAMEKIGQKKYEIAGSIPGKDLEGLNCLHPFIERKSTIVIADYISSQEGTGCVHIAPGHGQEDFYTGLKYNLPVIMPVDAKGKFDDTAAEFKGVNVHEANNLIIEKIKSNRSLLYSGEIRHSYPHCWRCKNSIIFRATEQWFMKIDHKGFRDELKDAIEQEIKWIPDSGKERIKGMIESRPDWCLSRQRYWGVPIPVFYCEGCNKELLDPVVIDKIAGLVAQRGSNVWFIEKAENLLPAGTYCRVCGNKSFKKETDIFDVWFESGVSHHILTESYFGLSSFPADIYLEGSDQHRGWFQTSLLTSMATLGKPPFKSVLTHGFVVDGEGKKMSKSVGNVISPQEVIGELGADILRIWVASSDYKEDVRISEQILDRLAESYRKIRNTCRFLLGNLYDFEPEKDAIPLEEMLEIDKWALRKTFSLLEEVNIHYENFLFHRVFHSIYQFCIIELSNFYLDVLKDRLYTFGKKSFGRRSAQTAISEILNVLVRIIAPILSFTAEEIWKFLPKSVKSGESVHLSSWPEAKDFGWTEELQGNWETIIRIRGDVLKILEEKRIIGEIGNALEAEVFLAVRDKNIYKLLEGYKEQLPGIFIVSGVSLAVLPEGSRESEQSNELKIGVKKAQGRKCERCWNFNLTVGTNNEYLNLCSRCIEAIGRGDRIE